LNQIQTQAYSAFANSQANVFLGASEGSGKFSLAVLAMSQSLHLNKKVVVVVSHKVIAQKKTALLTKVFNKKKVGRTFEDLSKDSQILANSDVIVTTP
jgi:replicative superfamily II helicase